MPILIFFVFVIFFVSKDYTNLEKERAPWEGFCPIQVAPPSLWLAAFDTESAGIHSRPAWTASLEGPCFSSTATRGNVEPIQGTVALRMVQEVEQEPRDYMWFLLH